MDLFLLLLSFAFTRKKLIMSHFATDAMFNAAVCVLYVATAIRQSLDGETVDAELPLKVGMSKPAGGLRGAVSASSGYGAAFRSKKIY